MAEISYPPLRTRDTEGQFKGQFKDIPDGPPRLETDLPSTHSWSPQWDLGLTSFHVGLTSYLVRSLRVGMG